MDKAAAHVGLKHGACAAPGRHRHPELLRLWRRRRGGNCDANETVWPEVEGDLDLHHLPADVGLDPLAGLHPRRDTDLVLHAGVKAERPSWATRRWRCIYGRTRSTDGCITR